MSEEKEDTTIYKVVVNHEEQYSIWPAHRENALGWSDTGPVGPKADCLSYIKEVWTDMRPLSLRKQMEEAEARTITEEPLLHQGDKPVATPQADDLVERLSRLGNPVEVNPRPDKTARGLKEQIDRGYVHIKFTNTSGGTELGVRLDPGAVDLSRADFENQVGTVHLEGGLTLNYVKVQCIADVDLQTLTGSGHLERAQQGAGV